MSTSQDMLSEGQAGESTSVNSRGAGFSRGRCQNTEGASCKTVLGLKEPATELMASEHRLLEEEEPF